MNLLLVLGFWASISFANAIACGTGSACVQSPQCVCQEQEQEPVSAPDYGPWESENGKNLFWFVPGKMSWWKADQACKALGAELAAKNDLRANFIYLNGTSPLGDLLTKQEGYMGYNYPNAEIWTSELEPKHQAWTYNPYFPKFAQTFQMDSKFAVVCIH